MNAYLEFKLGTVCAVKIHYDLMNTRYLFHNKNALTYVHPVFCIIVFFNISKLTSMTMGYDMIVYTLFVV